ncbi:MAG: LLM class flavin-dependent oxidoreductase, partial [Dehalococcoidia bacterium]|nr:LLM class flavin-dependent oxidoreductase [Dehalococcoidia bacterium]
MRFAAVVPIWGDYADPRTIRDLAVITEQAGWDGLFVADQIVFNNTTKPAVGDATVSLAAAATVTKRITLGTWVTAIPRHRPSRLAREFAALDVLSEGRMVLGAGLGGPAEDEFATFGEDPSFKVRAEKTDEALDLIARLWSGQTVDHAGKHYIARDVRFTPTPIQSPRIPVWVAVRWPNDANAPFRRAARWDGMMPVRFGPDWQQPFTPAEISTLLTRTQPHRTATTPFSV